MVGLVRFELTTSCTPCKRATRLRYSPMIHRKDEEAPRPKARQELIFWRARGLEMKVRASKQTWGVDHGPLSLEGANARPNAVDIREMASPA